MSITGSARSVWRRLRSWELGLHKRLWQWYTLYFWLHKRICCLYWSMSMLYKLFWRLSMWVLISVLRRRAFLWRDPSGRVQNLCGSSPRKPNGMYQPMPSVWYCLWPWLLSRIRKGTTKLSLYEQVRGWMPVSQLPLLNWSNHGLCRSC